MEITVVGAGVVGLVTALVLEEHGHTVHIVADAPHAATTSAVAGAIWFPYRAGPPARVAAWSARTREWLAPLAADHEAGVDLLTGYEITPELGLDPGALARPWWAADLDVGRAVAPVTGAPAAWTFRAPRMEPARFLPWLHGQLRARIEHRRVTTLASEPGDVVINCTGLHARELVGDPTLTGLLGQIVVTAPGSVDLGVTITDDRTPDAVFYIIPRRTGLVLGGCTVPWPAGQPPVEDPAITDRILRQARALGLGIGDVISTHVGVRPVRPHVRLERDPADRRIIHNYGHGGSGYTLARGCAESVAALVGAT